MSSIAVGALGNRPSAGRAGRLWLGTARILLLGLSLLFLFFSLAGISVGMTVQAGVYLFGMVALNLPHGGFEHFLNLRARRTRFTVRYLAGFLLLLALFAILFLRFPVAGLALALAVAMAKGGGADLRVMEDCTGAAHLLDRPQRLLAVMARGVPIMLLPILFFPGDFRFYSGMMVDLFAPGALATLDTTLLTARPWLGGLAFALITAHLLLGVARARRGPQRARQHWKHDALDTGLLVLFFTTVPVVLAVGLYFPLWYSARQIARSLLTLDRGNPSPRPAPDAPASAGRPNGLTPRPRLGTDNTISSRDCLPMAKSTVDGGEEREKVYNELFKNSLGLEMGTDNAQGAEEPGGEPGGEGSGEPGGEGSGGDSAAGGRDPGKMALYAWGVMMAGAVLTFGLAVGLWALLPHLPRGLPWLMVGVAFWTVFISIVALPHVVIGEWFDREQGIWSSPLPAAGAGRGSHPSPDL